MDGTDLVFPFAAQKAGGQTNVDLSEFGLRTRALFAVLAMQGLLASERFSTDDKLRRDDIANRVRESVFAADCLIAELSKQKEPAE